MVKDKNGNDIWEADRPFEAIEAYKRTIASQKKVIGEVIVYFTEQETHHIYSSGDLVALKKVRKILESLKKEV